MRLLFVTQDFPPDVGGIQTYSWELVRRWAQEVAVHVVAPDRPDAAEIDASLAASISRVDSAPEMLPLRGIPTVIREARDRQPDIAFHAQWQTVGASFLSRRLTGYPHRIVCAAHGRELLFNPAASVAVARGGYDGLRRLLLRIPDLFVPVSRYTAGLLHREGVDPSRTRVVPNGVDPERFRPADAGDLRRRLGVGDRPMLLTVGRLVARKGMDTTIRALPSLQRQVPDVRYVIVGSGPDRDRLGDLVDTVGVRDAVHFAGQVPWKDLLLYYNAADIFVMPSREDPPDVEGFGLVFLEANACGTPAVGAASGGVPDAIVDGETGRLVPPADPDALAAVLGELLQDPDRVQAMGRAGRRRAEGEASWDEIAASLLRTIRGGRE